jgi:hypothetical protein
MPVWIDDQQLYGAANDMADAFRAMYDDTMTGTVGDAANAALEAAARHCDRAVALDPPEIEAEYDRMFRAAEQFEGTVGTNGDTPLDQLDATENHLAGWVGLAADEFKERISEMRGFCSQQGRILREALVGVAGAYQAAVEARAGLHLLYTQATAAANNVMAEHQQHESQAKAAAVASVVEGMLTLDPTALKRSVAAVVVEVGKDFLPVGWPSGDADAVANEYHRVANERERSLGDGMRSLAANFRTRRDDAANEERPLVEPSPAFCDVSSPDFSYDKFMDQIAIQPGSFGASVEAERKKYADEHQDGEIDRRLNPGPQGDKGAV